MSDEKPLIGILKKHKNRFMEIIVEAGLDPQKFHTKETDVNGVKGFNILYSGSPFRFGLVPSEDDLRFFRFAYTRLAPTLPLSDVQPPRGDWEGIEKVYYYFRLWLDDHLQPYLEDLDESDHWAQIESKKSFDSLDPASERDHEPFTEPEKTGLRAAIPRLKELIIEKFDPVEEQLKVVNEKLDYLTESVDRLNRFDFSSVAWRIMISLRYLFSLGEGEADALIDLFKGLFTKLLPPE